MGQEAQLSGQAETALGRATRPGGEVVGPEFTDLAFSQMTHYMGATCQHPVSAGKTVAIGNEDARISAGGDDVGREGASCEWASLLEQS